MEAAKAVLAIELKRRITTIKTTTDLLRQHPHMGRLVLEFGNDAVRELFYRQYRIIYHIISDDRIEVLTLQSGLRPLQGPCKSICFTPEMAYA